uniref:Ovule protein n=1 Tax=Romanomermis culicivorax TaxID=13658 RepID=A0A915KN05_ROMCU
MLDKLTTTCDIDDLTVLLDFSQKFLFSMHINIILKSLKMLQVIECVKIVFHIRDLQMYKASLSLHACLLTNT